MTDPVEIERLLSALERIAMALEVTAGLARPNDDSRFDTSEAFYTDDLAQYLEEQKREARKSRGARMPPAADPLPVHGGNFSPREGEFSLEPFNPDGDATGEP